MSNVPDGEIWSRGESLQTTSKTILSPQFILDQKYFKNDSLGQQARCKWGLNRCRNSVVEKWEIWFPDRRNTAPELSLQRKVIVAEVGQEEETVHCRRRCHRPPSWNLIWSRPAKFATGLRKYLFQKEKNAFAFVYLDISAAGHV